MLFNIVACSKGGEGDGSVDSSVSQAVEWLAELGEWHASDGQGSWMTG